METRFAIQDEEVGGSTRGLVVVAGLAASTCHEAAEQPIPATRTNEFMNLCSDGHEEVCFEYKRCPVCEIKTQLEELKEELKESKLELQKLQEAWDAL